MTLTGIGKNNIKAFEPLMGGYTLGDIKIAVGAIQDDRAAGVLLFDILDDALMLDYIYVLPDFRKKGVATEMLKGFINEVGDPEPAAIHVNYPESAGDLHGFFSSMGFKLFRDGSSYRIPAADILDTPAFNKVISGKPKHRLSRLKDITNKEKNDIKKAFENARLDSDIVDDKAISGDLSVIAFDGVSDEPEAMVLCEDGKDVVSILYLVNFRHDTLALVDIIHGLKAAIIEKNGGKCDLLFVTMDEKMEAFAKTLVGDEDEFESKGAVISGIYMPSPNKGV